MSDLATIQDIKIPYPTEGVIRTAQLDDTVAPADSVQLAVNLNFDRVGAVQTRPGVTSYADDLVDAINNYGTLRNSIVPAGFDFVFQLGGSSDLSLAAFSDVSAVKVSETKIAVFWKGVDDDGYCRNFSIDQETGSVTPIGTLVEFDTTKGAKNKAILFNSSLVLNVWQGTGDAAFAQIFTVSGDTIVPEDSAYQFDSVGFDFSLAIVDSSHAICFYGVTSGAGIATVFAINLSTFAVTEPGSELSFNSGGTTYNSCISVGSDRFLNVYADADIFTARTFSVNTSTWAITAIGTALTVGAAGNAHNNVISLLNGTHYINIFQEDFDTVAAQVLRVDPSTYAVTAVGTAYSGAFFVGGLSAARFDTNHFLIAYSLNSGIGYVRMLEVNMTTYAVTAIANLLSGYDFGTTGDISAINLSSDKVLVGWANGDNTAGQAAMFEPFGEVVDGRYLYAGSGDSVFNTTDGTWTSRRSGLAEVSKPRFSQFLNRIWMVNGNEQIGGDPVTTSTGGSFSTDLVPTGFPPGDFIHAGFEGRVWVANKTLGVIYYTDIVQFTPPATYSLSFNPSVNFISNIAPQTGQTITALYRVPRALLVFTEDSITRIYGATSVDAYPAYNVGTFSQESIIETKTGIFFHHSSGFYQFDYGSQPVEISRRIIDFVKAIPRANYEDITGVYDGYDAVEWSVGAVTVEGVSYTNAYLRYTISTQVWTVYDYGFETTAMIFYDDGTDLNHLVGTSLGKTGALDSGDTDFDQPFYWELIDRWRSFTDMYYQVKSISGFNVYSENAAGANLSYQIQKSGPNVWVPLGTVTNENQSLLPNSSTSDFDVLRLRIAGSSSGPRIVIHGIEITQLTIKGQDQN
jgi:hypothetical protein